MSQSSNTVTKSFKAGVEFDLADRYHFVGLGEGDNEVVKGNATGVPVGVLTDFYRGAVGMPITVAIGGTTKVEAGGKIDKGSWVGSNANGAGVAKTANGDVVRGFALEGASAAGDIIEVMLVGPFVLSVPSEG